MLIGSRSGALALLLAAAQPCAPALGSPIGSTPGSVASLEASTGVTEPDAVFAVVPSLDRVSGRAVVAAAEAAGYRVFTWELLSQGPLPEAVLRQHLAHPVVRCIPEDRPEYRMGAAELAAWRGFLGAGGRLLLAGNEAARTLNGTDLLKRLLCTKFVNDDAGVFEVAGAVDDPELGAFGARLLRETAEYGAVRPDLLGPQNQQGVPFLWYQGGGVAAIKAKT